MEEIKKEGLLGSSTPTRSATIKFAPGMKQPLQIPTELSYKKSDFNVGNPSPLPKRTGSTSKQRELNIMNTDQKKQRDQAYISETERFLQTKLNIIGDNQQTNEKSTLDSFLIIIDKALNSNINLGLRSQDYVQLQQQFTVEERLTFESCKAIVDYMITLKERTSKLLELQKSSKIEETNGLQKSRFRDPQITKIEDFNKLLNSKDLEIEDFKSKLEIMQIKMKKLESNKDLGFVIQMPQTSIDVEYAIKINDQHQEFLKTHRILGGLQSQIFDQVRNPNGYVDQQNMEITLQSYANQYDKIKQIHDTFMDENSSLYESKIDLASRLETMQKNTKFLEGKLTSVMTEKEEQIIRLKSEIVIYKNKIVNYKSKLKEAVTGFETKKLQDIATQNQEILDVKNAVIEQLQVKQEAIKRQNEELITNRQQLILELSDNQMDFESQVDELNLIITQLSNRLQEIDKDYSQQLSKVDNIRDITQKKLNIEEKERTFNALKLEYLINNYRKLQLQKRFLQTTLEKDMKNLTQEMRKAELEMQKDIYVTSNSAQNRLNEMYSIIKESLRYVKEVIGFMNFDVEKVHDQEYLISSERNENSLHVERDDPIARYEKTRNQIDVQDKNQPSTMKDIPITNITLDQCFYKHIHELAEVLLSVLSEIYKESRTQTSTESLQLFDLLQSKTDKKIVSEIYNKFFAQNRIHFAQFLNKTSERNFDLQQERSELKMQVHRLSSQLQELMNEQEKEQEEELKQQQEQMQLQELVEEELKEQDLQESQIFVNPRSSLELVKNHSTMMHYHRNQTMTQPLNVNNNVDLQTQQSQTEIAKELNTSQPGRAAMNIKDLFLNMQQSQSNLGGRQSPAAVASVLFKSQEKRLLDMMSAENGALKERVRETRLILQRQITDLQEQLKLENESHYSELNKIKIEYGKDLGILHKTQKLRELDMRDEIELLKKSQIDELLKQNDIKIQQVTKELDQKYEEIKRKNEKTEMIKNELERELRKLKKQSNSVAQGGWGTFTIAFEDSNKRGNPISHNTGVSSLSQSQSPQKITLEGSLGKKLSRSSSNDNNSSDTLQNDNNDLTREEMPLEKLTHFIEVGFLMDSKNFNFVDNYKEKTFESTLNKHLFEFQDPIDNHKMITLQNKIKQQLVENFALFNEINPVYVTLNLGRTISPFWGDDSYSQDLFKLIKREGFYLNGENYIMVNFLKCDEPSLVLRVIAFDNEKCQQHSFDLIFEDLMLIVDGNMKLLEEDHHSDLCQIILNNLTMIKRKPKQKQVEMTRDEDDEDETSMSSKESKLKPNLFSSRMIKDSQLQNSGISEGNTLAVEHKLFFNEYYRTEYDKNNKAILAKHDKKKKGLVQEKSISTDYDKSIVYEAFEPVYKDALTLSMSQDLTQTFNLELLRGKMSEHVVLKISIDNTDIHQELMLYQTDFSKQHQSQQMTSEMIKLPLQTQDQTLGYIFSLEKIYGLDNFIIRIVAITKYDSTRMQNYEWNPQQQLQYGSLSFTDQTIYLIKLNNTQYVRMTDYEILNTEIRSLLFMHSYGYLQCFEDFGKLKALENVNIKTPLEKQNFSTMQLVYRDFGIIRIKHIKQVDQDESEDEMDEQELEDQVYYENSFVVYAFYDDLSCLSNSEIHIQLKIHGQQEEIWQKINVSEILNEVEVQQIRNDQEKYCKIIIDKLVMITDKEKRILEVDKNIQSMTEVIDEIKRKKYLAQLDQEDLMETEIDNKSLQVSLNLLAECPKITQVSIINRKVFKVTSYFVNNLKNLKLQQQTKRTFDWQLIYIDASQRSQPKSVIIMITEKDLLEIFTKLKALLNKTGDQVKLLQLYDEQEIFLGRVKKEKLIDLVLDCIVYNESKSQLQISITHLISRLEDRLKLAQQFRLCGSKFISKQGAIEDPDQLIYKSSLPQIEIGRKLVLNLEKEFSDKKYDIRIYELTLKNLKDEKKYQFEMFCTDLPNAIFRSEFYSQAQAKGKKMLMERFNIIQQMHQDYEENKFIRDGMVLAIVEQSFPHKIVFMLLEPASHIQWQFTMRDKKLNQIENRIDKEYFVQMARTNIDNGVIGSFNQHDEIFIVQNLGFQKELSQQSQIDVWQGNLKSAFNDSQSLIFAKNIQINLPQSENQQVFAECSIFTDRLFNSLRLRVAYSDQHFETSFMIETQRESSRILSGFLNIDSLKIKLIYSIEIAQAYTQQERAIRLRLKEPLGDQQLLDVILAEKHLLNVKEANDKKTQISVKEEIKFAFNTGFKDCYALFQKLPDIVTDFKRAFIQPNKKFEYMKQVDTSKLLYRKVVSYMDSSLIIFLRYDSIELAEKEWIVVLFDQQTQHEEEFKFKTDHILSKDELNSLNAKNDRIMKDVIARVVDKRLKIKIIEDKFQIVKLQDQSAKDTHKKRYLAYFIDPPLGVAADIKNHLAHNFDIKNVFRYSLTNPESMNPEIVEQGTQERMLTQLEKDDLLFDVSEILNPYELILRIKTYHRDTLMMISASDIKEFDIRKELMRDSVSYLMEPQKREDLAKYIVQNIYYDEARKRVFFLKSHNTIENL